MTDFYSVATQASLTLLGLWWLVLSAWPEGWAEDAAKRRTGYHVSLYFMLPGMMSALSLLSTDSSFFWRAGFGMACVLGAFESLSFATRPGPARSFAFLSGGFYAAGAVIAALPQLVTKLAGDGVTPLHVEGVLLTAILFLGVNLAWMHLVRRD